MHSRTFRRLSATAVAVFLGFVVVRTGVRAQVPSSEHPGQYTQSEIDAGSRIYARTCVGCHGPNGDMITGVDLRRGIFRRSSSDEDLAKVITTGVSGSGMPGFPLQPAELSGVIAFIRAGFDPAGTAVKVGNASRGHDLFVGKGQCGTCHRVNGQGPRVAPDLSDVGAARTPAALQRTLMDPASQMMPINRPVKITMKDGKTYSGRRLNEDTYTVQIIDQNEQLRSIDKNTIRNLTVETTSPMPSYAKTFTADEMSDMIAYLLTLRGL